MMAPPALVLSRQPAHRDMLRTVELVHHIAGCGATPGLGQTPSWSGRYGMVMAVLHSLQRLSPIGCCQQFPVRLRMMLGCAQYVTCIHVSSGNLGIPRCSLRLFCSGWSTLPSPPAAAKPHYRPPAQRGACHQTRGGSCCHMQRWVTSAFNEWLSQ